MCEPWQQPSASSLNQHQSVLVGANTTQRRQEQQECAAPIKLSSWQKSPTQLSGPPELFSSQFPAPSSQLPHLLILACSRSVCPRTLLFWQRHRAGQKFSTTFDLYLCSCSLCYPVVLLLQLASAKGVALFFDCCTGLARISLLAHRKPKNIY